MPDDRRRRLPPSDRLACFALQTAMRSAML
jgi:hypothetical protein